MRTRDVAIGLLLTVACASTEGEMRSTETAGVRAGAVEPFLGGLQVHTFTLDNGLVIKVVPDPSSPVVAYETWYGVGSADEVAGKTGLAHLFEHLMFKGSDVYADGEYVTRLEMLGADGLNAWTWLDQTVFLQAVPKAAFDEVAQLEAIRMHQLTVEQAPFASELEVVMNERRLSVDNDPRGKLAEVLFATAYSEHPYRAPTIGWMEDLEQMQVDDAVAFYRRYYAPDNATVVVVGDVEPEAAAATIGRHYGHLAAARPERPVRAPEPEQTEQRRRGVGLPIAADRVGIAWKVPAYTHDDIPALLVLDAALTAGQTGRLPRALRDAGYVADIGASVLPLRDPSLYEVILYGRPGVSAEVAEARFWTEIARVREEGISDGELAMGIAQWEAHTLVALEDALGKASFLGWSLTHTGDHRDGLKRLEAIRDVTAADVRRVARAYLRPERATVVIGRAEAASGAVAQPSPGDVAPAARVDVPTRDPVGPSTDPAGEVLERRVDGATVLTVHDPVLPVVHFRLWFPTGAAADPPGQEGLANLTAKMLLRGTTAHDRRAFEEAMEQLGATLSVTVDADGTLISGTSLASTWPAYVALVGEALASPSFAPEQIAQLVQEVDNELATRGDDDGQLASLALGRTLWGEAHPYGRDPRGTRASLPRLGADALRDFHARHLRAEGAVIGVAGGYDARLDQDLRAMLAGIPGKPPAPPSFPAPAWPERRTVVLVDKPDLTQAMVMMGQLGLDQGREDFAAFVLANDALGVGFGGRLFKQIRVEKGWSYFAYSTPQLRRSQCALVAGLAPGNDHAADAVALALTIVEQTDRNGLTPAELDRARSARTAGSAFLANTARKRLDLALRRETVGYDRAAATEAMATVTLAQANQALADALQPDRLVVVVVGTAAAIQEPLEARLGAPVDVVISWRDLL